ncbi:MAG: amidophosphoribosyltransferase [Candidatus Aminicenantes bacterium]|jgi:amidophosphoribosyltransferase|nr:amidophosphoribosyltransferase [Candidatus Aminicenantes bacterium]
MGGFFGVVSKGNCIADLFYGTDYHSHLGTKRGGMATIGSDGFTRIIHNIESSQFRSKFDPDLVRMGGRSGIGVISDTDDQPLLIRSHLGDYAIATVGVVQNAEALTGEAFRNRRMHLSEMGSGGINPTELVASLINMEDSFEAGISRALAEIEGSCSLLVLTRTGIYAARDRRGRTPVIIGRKDGAMAVTFETCAFPNLDYKTDKILGPGEIVFITAEGYERRKEPESHMQICSFLWVYYGYPASSYEGINVEAVRNRCGALLARRFPTAVDFVAGIPDSGIGHGLGYANEAHIPFKRPFVKYSPTWARSFMPQHQDIRDLVACMKLIPVRELIEGKRILFCEDSIVRGTQLKDTIQRLLDAGAGEIHMRPACPPLVYGCKFLNFSRSRSEMDLASRQAVRSLEGSDVKDFSEYARAGTAKYANMEESIRQRLNLTTLKYQVLDDLITAIGLPKEKLCTYCWDGAE